VGVGDNKDVKRRNATEMQSRREKRGNGDENRLSLEDRPVHDWFRFVLSFPPHLVREYVEAFGLTRKHRVLDPFCGTGTTVVECKKLGIPSVGIEANPMAHFASSVKADWTPDPERLLRHATEIAAMAEERLADDGLEDVPQPGGALFAPSRNGKLRTKLRALPAERMKLLLTNSISPLPLHKTLVLLDCMTAAADERFSGHEKLALAKTIVFKSSNLHFGPEVGVRSPKEDAAVIQPWLAEVRTIAGDLRGLKSKAGAAVRLGDAREPPKYVKEQSIDGVITSPPYPNEKDYTRTTRLEAVLLGFFGARSDIRLMKGNLVRSNTRSVYAGDRDDLWAEGNEKVQEIARRIEARRIEMGKTSGFERLYHRVTKLYFGGMARHLAGLRKVLRPGARLAYVVGDQASYLRVMIRTGQLLGEIAESLGYKLERIDLFRTRLATATKEQLREEVVILRWDGPIGSKRSRHSRP
jgi:DNA modification methylase